MSDVSGPALAESAEEWRSRHLAGRPSKIIGNPELRVFVERLLPDHTFAEIAAACRARFGPERAPSLSAISRYWRQKKAAEEWPDGGSPGEPSSPP